ncbi:MAG: HEAT repeat domain-containing protein, partial [Planctomycetota bacterium]
MTDEMTTDMIVEHINKLDDGDQAVAFGARQALMAACHRSLDPAGKKQRANIAQTLTAELTATTKGPKPKDRPMPKYNHRVRRRILRYLSLAGGEAQLPAIAAALADIRLREMARYALERIPAKAATELLIAAL